MEDTEFLALDLEMNCAEGGYTPGKIIQVGVAIGSLNSYRYNKSSKYTKFSWYINPGEEIYPRITELTGITTEDVRTKGVSHQVIYDEIKNLISGRQVYSTPIVWGVGDIPTMREEFKNNIEKFEIFGHRDIDVKTLHTFNTIIRGKASNSSLRSACKYYGLKFEGIPHRAEDDAVNTLNVFFHLYNRGAKIQQILNEVKNIL